jgi:hypothetical protein
VSAATLLIGESAARRLGFVRIVVCGFATAYVLVRSGHLLAVTDLPVQRFDPIGFVSVLEAPAQDFAVLVWVIATVLAGIAATLGWHHRFSGPAFAILLAWTLTYRLSWGQVLHTENLMVMHVGVLGFTRSAVMASLDARRSEAAPDRETRPAWQHSWPLQLMTLLTVLTYLVAGWAKIRNGGLDWLTGDVLRNQIALDNLRKLLLGDVHSAFGGWLTRYGWIFPPMAIASMVIEVGALVAIPRTKLRMWWLASAWLFHVGVLALMAIVFPYQLFGLAFVSMVPLDLWFDSSRAWLRDRRPLSRRGRLPARRQDL